MGPNDINDQGSYLRHCKTKKGTSDTKIIISLRRDAKQKFGDLNQLFVTGNHLYDSTESLSDWIQI
jgi:hypothetical protein